MRKFRFECLNNFQIGIVPLVLTSALSLASGILPAQANVFAKMTEIDLPVGIGAQQPDVFALKDGRVFLSWMEPTDTGFTVKTTQRRGAGWSEPATVVTSDDLFINWADFPSVAAFGDGTLAVHWLQENSPTGYDYDFKVALSGDQGATWRDPITPHRDRTKRQHGFVTLLPVGDSDLLAIWLDGRAYNPEATGAEETVYENAMQLRATTIGTDGHLSEDIALDVRTCSCCQTSAAITDSGTVIAVYRDRTATEVRDISVVRRIDGVWSDPATVHGDGWEIDGCPVNGPAIDARSERAVVAWFTAAQDVPKVLVAFSEDAGATFTAPSRVDVGRAAGRVDVVQLADGAALVSWVEWTSAGEALMICRAAPTTGCDRPQVISLNRAPGALNFPRMVLTDAGVYIAWTQPLAGASANPDTAVTVRMVFGEF